MRITDVCAFYAPKGGGVRTYIDRKLAVGAALGHDITVIAPGVEDHVEMRGPNARIVWIKSPQLIFDANYRYFGDQAQLHAALDAACPDMVEVSSPWRSASMVADWQGTAPRALVMHADPLSAYAYRWFEPLASQPMVDRMFARFWRHLRRLDDRFDRVISASQSLTDRLRAGLLNNVVTNPMGIDPGVFSPALRDPALRQRLLERCGLGDDALLLIGVGRHAPEKRWPMVVQAATAAGVRRPVGLILIGDGRGREGVQRVVGDNPHIQLLAPTSNRAELARLMASTDALVHGCEAETFCMVAAEARASGLTLIAPDRGGASDQARAAGGVIYQSGNGASLADAIVGHFDARRQRPTLVTDRGATRTMDDHFASLFADYTALLESGRRAG